MFQSWQNVPINQWATLTLSKTLSPSTNCYFETVTENTNVIDAISGPVSVNLIPIIFNSPQNSSTILIPANLTLLLTTPVNTSISDSLTIQMICGSASTNIVVNLNSELAYPYPEGFNGQCSLQVIDAPSYYLLPGIDYFYFKYDLEFLKPPTTIKIGRTFDIYVETANAIPVSPYQTTTLILRCQNTVIQVWNDVILNQKNTLQYDNIPTSNPLPPNCRK